MQALLVVRPQANGSARKSMSDPGSVMQSNDRPIVPAASSNLDDLIPHEQWIFEPMAAPIDIAARVANDARAVHRIIERRMRMPVNPKRGGRSDEVGQMADEARSFAKRSARLARCGA